MLFVLCRLCFCLEANLASSFSTICIVRRCIKSTSFVKHVASCALLITYLAQSSLSHYQPFNYPIYLTVMAQPSKAAAKLEKFIKEYDYTQYDALPKFMKRRVDSLKKLQLEHINIQHQYHKELQALELKYEELYKPLYEKRLDIVSGKYEPTEEECQLPANIVENEFDGDQENSNAETEPILTEEEENQLKTKVKGVPGFWLGCLVSTFNFNDSIEPHDRLVLRHLKDIKLSYGQVEDFLTYKLEFFFDDDNVHFTNKVLTKTYHLKLKPDEKDPFSYEGFEVCKSEGCQINWNPGRDTTTKTVTVKQQNKSDGRTREKKKEVGRDSFFYFFKPPEVPEGQTEEDVDEELAAVMAADFELGEVLRQSIIPRAALYYIGYMVDDDDEEDDDEDDDDDGGSEADDDSDSLS